MSALSPHIRSLRAEAEALGRLASNESSDPWLQACLESLSQAKREAADVLEEHDRELSRPVVIDIPPRQA